MPLGNISHDKTKRYNILLDPYSWLILFFSVSMTDYTHAQNQYFFCKSNYDITSCKAFSNVVVTFSSFEYGNIITVLKGFMFGSCTLQVPPKT